jgi:CO/xanthine dehydrogenase FAD-binding subunit
MADYFRPQNLHEALAVIEQQPCQLLAGGTDFFPAQINAAAWGAAGPAHRDQATMVDLSAIATLRAIRDTGDQIEIGALATWSELMTCALPGWFDAVRLAAREVGGRQIQNRATLAGNLCNASPAADGVPPLLALDARVRLQSATAQRELALPEFILGNRATARRCDELVTAVIIPKPAATSRSLFLKLGARRYLVISIAMVALTIACDDDGIITHAAIAVGACSEVAQRLTALEQRLTGTPLALAATQLTSDDCRQLSPISDMRASADYRRHSAGVLIRRGLTQLSVVHPEATA